MDVENLSPPSSPATSTKQEQNRIEMSNFLFHAVLGNDILLIRKILANEIYDINHFEKGSRTALQEACRKGNIEVVKLLIESNADPNISAGDKSPLHFACAAAQIDIVEFLISNGANIDAQDRWGNTPLHIRLANLEIVSRLLASGANCNIQNMAGETPLHLACYYGMTETVALLVEHGAVLDLQNLEGKTALHLVCVNGQCSLASLLLQNGANPTIKSKSGANPLALVKRCRCCEYVVHGFLHYHLHRKAWLSFSSQIDEIPHSPKLRTLLNSSDLYRFVTEFM